MTLTPRAACGWCCARRAPHDPKSLGDVYLPNQPAIHDLDEPALALVARNDANEQENIEHFHPAAGR
jgi:hypothetical protein